MLPIQLSLTMRSWTGIAESVSGDSRVLEVMAQDPFLARQGEAAPSRTSSARAERRTTRK